MKHVLTAIICVLISGGAVWAQETPVFFVPGEPFTLSLSQSAQTEDGLLNVEYIELVDDSLCPEDAQCIWAGTVIIKLKVAAGEKEAIFDVQLYESTQIFGENADAVTIEFVAYTRSGAVQLKVIQSSPGIVQATGDD